MITPSKPEDAGRHCALCKRHWDHFCNPIEHEGLIVCEDCAAVIYGKMLAEKGGFAIACHRKEMAGD